MILTISPHGETRCLYTEALDLTQLGQLDIRRASNVEPAGDAWYAHMVGGETLGPFQKRSEAIQAEVAWLEEHVL